MTEAMDVRTLQGFLGVSPFNEVIKMEVVSADAETQEVIFQFPFHADLERGPGSNEFHGGAIASAIDIAGGYALIFVLERPVPTIDFRVDFLRPAKNTDLTVKANVLRTGRTVSTVDIKVTDKDDTLIAIGRGNYSTSTR